MSAIFYGSTNGNTRDAARILARELGLDAACHDIAKAAPAALADHRLLILGTSTWGCGDLQDDWIAFLPKLGGQRFDGVSVAVFGLGDASTYCDSFVDAMAEVQEAFTSRGAVAVGSWPTDGYAFNASKAVVDGRFLGLVLDADGQSELTDERCAAWAGQLKPLLG